MSHLNPEEAAPASAEAQPEPSNPSSPSPRGEV